MTDSARAIESDFDDAGHEYGDAFDFDSAGLNADRQLWCAVLLQAVREAQGRYIAGKGNSTADAQETIQRTATEWLLKNGDDFYMVCEMAGINPKKARRSLRMILARL